MSKDIIPIVNENDTVAVQDMKFGDNDTLSAHIASLADADYLFLLTDVDGLYTGNPNSDPTATIIPLVENIEDLDVDTSAGAGTTFGTGGMATKINAARLATAAGCHTVVMNSNMMENLTDIVCNGAAYGTLFLAVKEPLGGRKRWILLQKPAAGHIVVNSKAEVALNNDKSLVGTHIVSVEGTFTRTSPSLSSSRTLAGRCASSGAPSSTTPPKSATSSSDRIAMSSSTSWGTAGRGERRASE